MLIWGTEWKLEYEKVNIPACQVCDCLLWSCEAKPTWPKHAKTMFCLKAYALQKRPLPRTDHSTYVLFPITLMSQKSGNSRSNFSFGVNVEFYWWEKKETHKNTHTQELKFDRLQIIKVIIAYPYVKKGWNVMAELPKEAPSTTSKTSWSNSPACSVWCLGALYHLFRNTS